MDNKAIAQELFTAEKVLGRPRLKCAQSGVGTRGRQEEKTTKQMFPSRDDGKDGKRKSHASQTDGRDNQPLIWSWRGLR